ncbi:hypothetical protein L0F63_004634 [Massospora cicadina]|nr:hypothetical protein L0F63_004634 [Massospora cicadina]
MKGILLLFLIASTLCINLEFSPNKLNVHQYYNFTIKSIEEYLDLLAEKETGPKSKRRGKRSLLEGAPNHIRDEAIRVTPYAAATYCKNKRLKSWSFAYCKAISNHTRLVKVIHNKEHKLKAIITSNEYKKEIVVAFRGSVNFRNWLSDFNFYLTDFSRVEGAAVHLGFKKCADALRPRVVSALRRLRHNPKMRSYNITVTGHSLGGAIATLSALDIQSQLNMSWSQVKVITYGQPRVGNRAFAMWYNSLPLNYIRVVNDNDVVPHTPPNFIGYFHINHELFITPKRTYLCLTNDLECHRCSNSYVPNLG